MYEMRIQEHQLWVFRRWIKHSWKVECFVLLTSRDTTARFEAKHLLQALKILSLYRVKSKSHWYNDKYALSLVDLLLYLV